MKLDFRLREKSKNNQVYIQLNFEGGDADTQHPEEHLIKDVKFEEIEQKMDIITAEIAKYKLLKEVLDTSNDLNYEDVEDTYGTEIAKLLDDVPNDPQSDFQYKCYLDSIEVVGYNAAGDKYSSYIR